MAFEPSDNEAFCVRVGKNRECLSEAATCEQSFPYPNEIAARKFARGVAETDRFAAVVGSRQGVIEVFGTALTTDPVEDEPAVETVVWGDEAQQPEPAEVAEILSQPQDATVVVEDEPAGAIEIVEVDDYYDASDDEPETAEGRAHANFKALAETAPSEQGRAFWLAKAQEVMVPS